MRIGTWNLAGGWGADHRAFLRRLECDLLLLTEVPFGCDPVGFRVHHTVGLMTRGRWWAAICSAADLVPLPDPEHATAMTEIDGLRVCCSVLPWRSCGRQAGWVGENTAERTRNAVAAVESARPDVWGGDWNHSLTGTECAGSLDGRGAIVEALTRLRLEAPTSTSPHRFDGVSSIDHVAVPATWHTDDVQRIVADKGRRRLSDHDAYVVAVTRGF